MRDPIDRLLDEHRSLMQGFGELRRVIEELERRGDAALPEARPALEAVARMMAGDLLAHSRREDEALFPALEAALGAPGGPTAAMREEHEAIHERAALFRRTLHQLNEIEHPAIVAHGRALEGLARGGASAESLRETAHALLDLVEAHFAREEQILFPMARDVLSPGDLARVAERMDQVHASSAL